MNNKPLTFIQKNSPDGGFLQSEEWRKFQEAVGRKTYTISGDSFHANIIEHKLPLVGKYFYVPRGPIMEMQNANIKIKNDNAKCKIFLDNLINLAEENKAGWIRIEPASEEILDAIKNNIESLLPRRTELRIQKSPHDMQPREILVMDINKSEEQLLSEMKSKTRYNIRLAEKKEVKIIEDRKYIDEFIRLTRIMAKRQGIQAHPDEYYQKMMKNIPSDILKLYVAKHQGNIVAANLVAFYGDTCTYLHGASDDEYKNVMAPFLLQWRQIRDAKRVGCEKYDFGGVKINSKTGKSWAGVTRFKTGFAPSALPIEFPGSWDIVVNSKAYFLYRLIQKIKSFLKA
jgi:peptidoglycan pentaglycine glycine transferase (the first glycine)